jgi:hypothetical protein
VYAKFTSSYSIGTFQSCIAHVFLIEQYSSSEHYLLLNSHIL